MRRVAAMRWQEYATAVRAGQEKGGEIPALFPPQGTPKRALAFVATQFRSATFAGFEITISTRRFC